MDSFNIITGVFLVNEFDLLNRRDIIDVLDGDTKLGDNDSYEVKMPYLSGPMLVQLCNDFGLVCTYGSQSRWVYLNDLLSYVNDNQMTDELLRYMFNLDKFTGLTKLGSPQEIDSAYKHIVDLALKKINSILYLGRHELKLIDGHFYLVESGTKPIIDKTNITIINIPYVHGLSNRCEKDFVEGNYDSVVTKSRTLMEEVLVYILEQNNVPVPTKGDLKKLYAAVKPLFNMNQKSEFDKRVNDLLSGLEKIINSIAEMRNTNSDAHGVGSKRINIRESKAKLIMNSAILYCEYILSIEFMHE